MEAALAVPASAKTDIAKKTQKCFKRAAPLDSSMEKWGMVAKTFKNFKGGALERFEPMRIAIHEKLDDRSRYGVICHGNDDGIPDIAVVGAILGKGDGTFQNPLPLDIPTTIPGGTVIATADFNGDGRADLVWESDVEAQTAGVVGVMLGNGDGTFQAAIETAIPYGGDLAVGDFNGDGRADLAVTNGSNGVYSTVSILLGNGDGTFQTPAVYQLPTLPASVRVGDFNGDGRSDIAILSQPNTSPNGMVSVMLSNSDGSLQPSVNTNVPGPVTGFVTGDFNGDGRLDIAVDEGTAEIATGQSLYILYGNGDGTMQAPVLQSTPLYDCLAAADFNRDGRTDLVGLHVPNSEATQALGVSLGQAAPQGSLTATAVLNAASYQPGIEAGSWVMILGTNLAASSRTWQASDFTGVALPTVVDGVSVTIDGNPAFVEYISSTQINVLAPGDNAIGPVNVVVTNNGQATVPAVAQLQTGAPGFFMTPSYNVAASVLPGYAAVTTAAPAEPGDLVVLWATGFGPTAPPTPAGTIVTGAPPTAALPVVTVGGMEVPVISSVLTPGTAGLYQITIQLPANVPTGTPVVQASIGAIETQPRATLIVGAH